MKTALITGASSGIGKEFAHIFASKGYNLILVSRTKKHLDQVAKEIQNEHDANISVLPYDLSKAQAAQHLFDDVKKKDIQINVLINNAGFATYGPFVEMETSTDLDLIDVNIRSLTALTSLFTKEMVRRNEGKILNVASMAAFQPIQHFAVYAASKAYVLNFTEALHDELRNTAVTASVLCPGPTATKFESRAKMNESTLFKGRVMEARHVAQIGYEGLMKGKMTIIPGWRNKVMAFLSTIAPSRKLVLYLLRGKV